MSTSDPGSLPAVEHAEVVGPPSGPAGASGRRFVASFSVAALAVGAVTAGVWAWQAWADQGAQPAEALPGNTLAYAALDLDPPGGQKLAAYKTLRKFPSLKKDLGLGSVDDLHQAVVDGVTSDSGCKLGYLDFKAWAGDRAAFAVVDQDGPTPVAVVQVDDAGSARTALDKAGRRCGFAAAVSGEWAVLAETPDVARRVTRDAARGTLADDKDYQRLVGKAGDPGLVTLYAAPEAGPALLDAIEDNPYSAGFALYPITGALDPVASFLTTFVAFSALDPVASQDFASSAEPTHVSPALRRKQARLDRRMEHFDELSPKEQQRLIDQQMQLSEQLYGSLDEQGIHVSADPGTDPSAADSEADFADDYAAPELPEALRSGLRDFSGLGGIGRFAGGGLEVELVGDDLHGIVGDLYGGTDGDAMTADLPEQTAVAFGAGLADGWVDALFQQFTGQPMSFGSAGEKATARFEKATGLDVPADLEALGGDGVTVIAGPGFDPEHLMEGSGGSVAVRVSGDADTIEAALDKLRVGLGRHAADSLQSRRLDGGVLIGPDADYLDTVARGGRLADSDRFHQAVPDADKATSVLFVDFDAGDWLVKSSTAKDRKDAEPLDAFGLTVTKGHGEQHVRYRLSFD